MTKMLPYQRGFFCNDLSIRYPYRDDTISVTILLLSMLLGPTIVIIMMELMRLRHHKYHLKRYANALLYNWGIFSFGFIGTYLSTEMGKCVIRRLRPHFYDACRPRLLDGTALINCDEDRLETNAVQMQYIERYSCTNKNLSVGQLRELYVSFPSAHASLSFYAMIFMAFYLDAVWQQRQIFYRLLKHFIQFILVTIAWFISLTRIADHWHHWSDVFAGSLIGILLAVLNALYVGRLKHYHMHFVWCKNCHQGNDYETSTIQKANCLTINSNQNKLQSLSHQEPQMPQQHEQYCRHLANGNGNGNGNGIFNGNTVGPLMS